MGSPPRVYKTEAIIIKQTRLGEADEILTLYTPNLGKLRVVAKGVRRPKSKLGGHVEPLTRSALMLARGQNLDIITQGQTIDSFMPLRNDLLRIGYALYAAELVDRFTPEHLENYPVYRLLLDTLHRLEWASKGELTLRYFELHLLDHLGYRPELRQCVACRAGLQPITNLFSPSAGGVLCPSCGAGEPLLRPISLNALKVIRLLQDGDFATCMKLRLRPELSGELERLMREYIRYLLEREVKSVAFLDKLRQPQAVMVNDTPLR